MSVIIIGRIDLMITKGTVSVILMALNARWKCSYNNGTLDITTVPLITKFDQNMEDTVV